MALGKAKNVVQPNWHPDFRNAETLPDVKFVRTDFLLNFIAVFVLLVLLFYNVQNEYSAISLNREITMLKDKIVQKRSDNDRNLKLSADFEELSKKAEELAKFVQNPVSPPLFLLTLANKVPSRNILLQSIRFQDRTEKIGRKTIRYKGITLTGSLTGSSAEATQMINDYKQTLESMEIWKGTLDRVELDSLSRDKQLGIFKYTIFVYLKKS